MRLRNKENEKTLFLQNNENVIHEIKEQCNPAIFFDNNNPIELEIGCGKGKFIISKALENPDINFIAIEKELTVAGVALKKALNIFKNNIPDNLKFMSYDVRKISSLFLNKTISKIYLNFSDPWPKKKHEKNRLTHHYFQEIYSNLLYSDAKIVLKTDNDSLFNYSFKTIMDNYFFRVEYFTTDLYNSIYLTENISTEYEDKFTASGKNINMLIASNQI
ncbi:tRNA (guanosine(46)-N7)-methyltransferase TrmB [Spiroplasma endosymbiont of Labia minor]|uniref:tRNA (guanosine(46)-N7)-methyltransferase TrmB n=1 Tax=Spiroplasma endosymbiont of Labia minor TaxID=3066305 RepID=UPI0030CCF8B6